ncbi:MAG: HAMP domain-containing histidine kinase [Acidobacteriota bacterium]|nr:HAMP domain-containing histidine kinase [Acidobacteriota bacterium]
MKRVEPRNIITRYGFLIVALGVILVATLALVIMQYRSVRRTEAQTRAALEANLDLHLLGIVDEARRGMVDRASYITHSLGHNRLRDRDVDGLALSFARAKRRYPEIGELYGVFFERGAEGGAWRVLRYVAPAPDDPATSIYKGVPVGHLVIDPNTTEALRRAWLAIPDRAADATYTAFAPISLLDTEPRQIFFHTVYEPNHVSAQDDAARVGLFAFTADATSYPSADYLNNLVARFAERAASGSDAPGQLAYRVTLNDAGGGARDLVAIGDSPEPLRRRGFDPAERLFPTLTFGVELRDQSAAEHVAGYTRSSLLLGLGAAGLSLVGLVLTWRATEREMRVAQLKSDFLASISHELKTPLTAIRAFGDLLHSGRARDPERIREYGGMIKTESDRLTALLNNILEASRLERGIRRYRLEEGSLGATVSETAEVFRHTAEARGFTIEIALPSPPIKTKFDEGAIRQAILNLLSNAAKYSGGKPDAHRIEVAVSRTDGCAVIEVRDHGIGIASAEQRRIFDLFHRAPQPDAQARGGTGIGLAIVREIARAHGGEVSVESQPEEGAIFRLWLPLLLASTETGEAADAATESKVEGDDKGFGRRGRAERRYRLAR